MMKNLLSTALLTILSLAASAQLLNEPLRDGTLPAGFSQSEVTFQTSAGGYARFDATTATLTTRSFTVPNAGATVSFEVAKFGSGGDGPITVESSLNGGPFTTVYTSPTPTSSTYVSAEFQLTAPGDYVLRFNRAASPTQKRLRDLLVVANAPTPVSLVSFDATPAGSKADLKWVTASELDNAFFSVEVSRDGGDFAEAGRVDGAGTSRSYNSYGFAYDAPAAGRYYFRLAQHDYDGQVNYSSIVTADLARSGKKFSINGANHLVEDLVVELATPGTLRIVDTRGAVVRALQLGAGRHDVRVADLAAGIYLLTDGETTLRFVR